MIPKATAPDDDYSNFPISPRDRPINIIHDNSIGNQGTIQTSMSKAAGLINGSNFN